MFTKNETFADQIRLWLREDIGSGDVTTEATIPVESQSVGILHVKESGYIAGLPVAEEVFRIVDSSLQFNAAIAEGDFAEKGTIIAKVQGATRSILTGERLALNLLQRMSGIATRTRQFVEQTTGTKARLVDTRKTTPGHRMLEKYAVKVGGGHNHRFGLYDAVMIKDNHIVGAGGIAPAIRAARAYIPHTMKIEVEVENLAQLEEALAEQPDIIMLDNMTPELMKKAVQLSKSHSPHIIIEASGSINLENIRAVAETGVDVISVGRLTYSVNALDISLDLNKTKGQQV
ncbi:carboxylating nicotinate-nucleotide diphosphorylase [Paenibacillus senegalensis]|uniref:carboxylating nicotinate-nucleotide diphosphorylase n=1 Tax=Paenibacillus senegalensis TaxID=1465766 RepID=UPI0002880B80|nr:carboxylating nicotinate-nucleotide diphosphorylase [Paenibacillus senegalensis]